MIVTSILAKEQLMRIAVDRTRCQGTGMCEALAPDMFEVDEHGEVAVLQETVGPEQQEIAGEAVAACPTASLSLVE